jgi:hypothetical protein
MRGHSEARRRIPALLERFHKRKIWRTGRIDNDSNRKSNASAEVKALHPTFAKDGRMWVT